MSPKNNPTPEPAGREFSISRTFDAPRDIVFSTWTEPGHLARWWGPRDFSCPVCEVDLRVGGSYRIVMRSPDGIEYPITGIYREILAPERIVTTMDVSGHPPSWHDLVNPSRAPGDANPAGELLSTVTFVDLGGSTRVDVRIRFKSEQVGKAMLAMGMTEGWGQSLDRFDGELKAAREDIEKREIRTTRTFRAPRELVFKAWTDPKHISRWWGPVGFTTTTHRMELRPGGAWSHTMHGPDGTDYKNEVVFVEVREPDRIVFDHVSLPKFKGTWLFDEAPGGTRVTMQLLFGSTAVREQTSKFGAVEGAQQTLERLGEFLAGS
jgi:uncharacterized protein YndB with AHSA1/START domain